MRQVSNDSPAREAFADFAVAHGQRLLRLAHLLTSGDGPLAEDLVHTVLLRLGERGIGDLDDPPSYARRAVINEFHSHLRRVGRDRSLHDRLVVLDPSRGSTTDHRDRAEERLVIFAGLRELGERERTAIVLRYYEDLPDEEIGTILGCSRSTVRSLIHRAMPKLRRRLSGDDEGDPQGDRDGKEDRR